MRVVSLTLTKRGASLIEKADFHVDSFLKGYWSNLTPEQLDTTLSSSMNAVTLHNVRRIEEGKVRLDTAFFDTVMISRTLTAQRLGEHGLRTSEFRVLLALYLLGPSATASHIADYLFLKSSDVTTPIKALEAKGLITKERSADNRRTKPLALTDAGLEKTEGLAPLRLRRAGRDLPQRRSRRAGSPERRAKRRLARARHRTVQLGRVVTNTICLRSITMKFVSE